MLARSRTGRSIRWKIFENFLSRRSTRRWSSRIGWLQYFGVEPGATPSPSTPGGHHRRNPPAPPLPPRRDDTFDLPEVLEIPEDRRPADIVGGGAYEDDQPQQPGQREGEAEEEEFEPSEDAGQLRPIRPNYNLRRVLQKLPQLVAAGDNDKAKRLLLGLHERLWHSPINDYLNLLRRCGMDIDVLNLAREAVQECHICRKFARLPHRPQMRVGGAISFGDTLQIDLFFLFLQDTTYLLMIDEATRFKMCRVLPGQDSEHIMESVDEVVDISVRAPFKDRDGPTGFSDVSRFWSGVWAVKYHESFKGHDVWSSSQTAYRHRYRWASRGSHEAHHAETSGGNVPARSHVGEWREMAGEAAMAQNITPELWWSDSCDVCVRDAAQRILRGGWSVAFCLQAVLFKRIWLRSNELYVFDKRRWHNVIRLSTRIASPVLSRSRPRHLDTQDLVIGNFGGGILSWSSRWTWWLAWSSFAIKVGHWWGHGSDSLSRTTLFGGTSTHPTISWEIFFMVSTAETYSRTFSPATSWFCGAGQPVQGALHWLASTTQWTMDALSERYFDGERDHQEGGDGFYINDEVYVAWYSCMVDPFAPSSPLLELRESCSRGFEEEENVQYNITTAITMWRWRRSPAMPARRSACSTSTITSWRSRRTSRTRRFESENKETKTSTPEIDDVEIEVSWWRRTARSEERWNRNTNCGFGPGEEAATELLHWGWQGDRLHEGVPLLPEPKLLDQDGCSSELEEWPQSGDWPSED